MLVLRNDSLIYEMNNVIVFQQSKDHVWQFINCANDYHVRPLHEARIKRRRVRKKQCRFCYDGREWMNFMYTKFINRKYFGKHYVKPDHLLTFSNRII